MCDMCGRLTDGDRVTKIVEVPARLISTLKYLRYDQTSHHSTQLLQVVKLDQHIHIDQYQYEIYSAVVHYGSSIGSGHYYTFARDKTEWFEFNDCSVMKTTPEELGCLKPTETPYILFYSRQNVGDPEALPSAVLSDRLQGVLAKDQSKYEFDKRQLLLKFHTQSRNDDPSPPECGSRGFTDVTGKTTIG